MKLKRTEYWKLALRDKEFRLPAMIRRLMAKTLLPSPYQRDQQLHSREVPLIFVHIPKTAGTSLCQALHWEYGHIPLSRYYDFDADQYQRSQRIAFVRHPKTRLHSAYNYLKSAIGINQSRDVLWAEDNLGHYESFSDFVLSLRQLNVRSRIMLYPHFRPQADWVVLPGQDQPDLTWTGRFEQLAEDVRTLEQMLNLSIDLGHDRKPQKKAKEVAWSEEMEQIVEDVYARDYQLFGYQR